MHTAEYKFQIGQTVFIVNTANDSLQSGTVLQVTIDIYLSSTQSNVTDKTYVVKLLGCVGCSENIEVSEEDLYATVEEAAIALAPFIGDK